MQTMLLILLDEYLPALYCQMLTMYYQSPESNGQTEENAMRAMPWARLMVLFKKACMIEELARTAAYTASAFTTPDWSYFYYRYKEFWVTYIKFHLMKQFQLFYSFLIFALLYWSLTLASYLAICPNFVLTSIY